MRIDITGVNLIQFIKKVYDLSLPQGLGFLHYRSDSLSDEEAKENLIPDNNRIIVDMDYVRGRACKMVVFKEKEKLLINYPWYDHTDQALQQLLTELGIGDRMPEDNSKHSIGCNCSKCRGEKQ